MSSSGEQQFGRSVAVRKGIVDGGWDQCIPHSNSAVPAAFASALKGSTDSMSIMPPGPMQYSARSAPISSTGAPQQHACQGHFNDPYNEPHSRTADHYDLTPATWSAWINEERRRSDIVDSATYPHYGPPQQASSASHTIPPQFLENRVSEFDDLASRLPHGLLGGMLEGDWSDTTSRSTTSRRARLGTEGSAPTMPGMDLFRHEESQNLSRCGPQPTLLPCSHIRTCCQCDS